MLNTRLSVLTRVVPRRTAHTSAVDACMLKTLSNMAISMRDRGQLEQSQSLFRQVVDGRREANGPSHPETLYAIGCLAALSKMRGHYSEAEDLARQALDGARQLLGDYHPDTLELQTGLADVLKDRGKLAEAEKVAREAVERSQCSLGTGHPDTLLPLSNLGQACSPSLPQDNMLPIP
jgi:tetratricopeptide (TPR) repeat protein